MATGPLVRAIHAPNPAGLGHIAGMRSEYWSVLMLELEPQSLRGVAERTQALSEIQVHVVVASKEAFGEVLRYADGMGEVQGGGTHGGEDLFAYQPAGMVMLYVVARLRAGELGNMSFELAGVMLLC